MLGGAKIVGTLGLPGRLAIGGLSLLPSTIRERLIFGGQIQQKALQRVLRGPAPVIVQYKRGLLRGLSFSCYTSEKYFLMGPNYEREMVRRVAPLIRPNHVVYDIGAHAGFWSLLFSRLCPQGCVWAFEPSPVNLTRLRDNTAGQANIKIVATAVSDAVTTLRFINDSSYSRVSPDGETIVQAIALDSQGLPDPDFIKIDIEGHAARALGGAGRMIERARPTIFCEIHNSEEFEAVSRLSRHQYRVRRVEQSQNYPFHLLAIPF